MTSSAEHTPDQYRSVTLERTGFAQFVATNGEGATIEVGEGDRFSPVELLLAGIAA